MNPQLSEQILAPNGAFSKENSAPSDGGLYDPNELDSILNCKSGCSINFARPENPPQSKSVHSSGTIPDCNEKNRTDFPTNSTFGPSLEDLDELGAGKKTKNTRSPYAGSAWLSPYVAGFPPTSTHLQLVQCHNIGPAGFGFYFPLSFRYDIIAVRFCGTDHYVDLCAKIVEQKGTRIPGKGFGCLIDCQFMGKIFLK